MTTPLTDDEQRAFFELLQRVCEHHIDHFLLMKMDTTDGPCFININFLPAGDPEVYVQVGPDVRLANQ
jgi:hypothetical protein